jgi:hypothetical protein
MSESQNTTRFLISQCNKYMNERDIVTEKLQEERESNKQLKALIQEIQDEAYYVDGSGWGNTPLASWIINKIQDYKKQESQS